MESKNNKLIVVLGMHRSGTSAITRGLQVMAVRLGNRLLPPLEGNNPRGFFEDIDLNALNIEMLSAIDSDWCHLAAIDSIDIEVLRKQGYFLRASELLRQKVSGASVFGFKDPRMAKLLPFWKCVFSHCQFNVSYVLALRNPLSVVKSLAKRDDIDAEHSYLLWLGHVITSLTGSAGDKRVIVDYDRLILSADRELMRIAKCTDLEIDITELQIFKSEFLDQGLRNTLFDVNDLLLDAACPPLVREMYTVLLDVGSDKTQLENPKLQKLIKRWAKKFEFLKTSLTLADRFYTRNIFATQAVSERDGQIAGLNQAVSVRDGQIAGLNQAVSERDRQIAGLNQAVSERDGQIAGLNQAVSERDGQIAGFNQAVTERDGQIAGLNQAVSERDGQIAGFNQAVSERDGQIAGLNQAVTERDGQIAGLNQAMTERDGQIAGLNQAVNQALVERDAQFREREAELGIIFSSHSWKMTRPLRFAGRILRGAGAKVRADQLALRNAKGNSFETEKTPENMNVIFRSETGTALGNQPISLEHLFCCGRRILLVSYYCPSRAHAGGQRILDIFSLIKSAFSNVQIDLYTHKRPAIDWSYEDVEKIFDNIFLSQVEDLSLRGFSQLHTAATQYDVIDLQFHQSAYDIESWRKIGQKILFTPMESHLRGLLIALRCRDMFSMGKMQRNIFLATEELMFSRKADEVVCVSEKDASSLRMFCHATKVSSLETAVSNIEFPDAFDDRHKDIAPEFKQPIILFIAYFGSQTNIDALKWYLTKVHPLINKALPEYKLHIVGRGDLSIFNEYQSSSIEFIGEVPTLAPFIREAKIGISPALTGGGFRGKINQYSIFGVPVVASALSAKGLIYQDGLDIFITNHARQFAKQCIRLLRENDLNREMGQRAREKAFTNYTWESRMDDIKKIYNLEVG